MKKKVSVSIRKKRKSGQPTLLKQADNRERCQKAFNQGLSILSAAERLELNKETICNYYKEFREKLVDTLDNDFIQVQKTAKEMAMKKLEDNIREIESLIVIATKNLSGGKNDSVWVNHLKQLQEVKANFEQQRYAIEMTPTIDISIDQIIEEGFDEIEQTKPSGARSSKT